MPKVKNFRQPPNLPQLEQEIRKFWEQDQTFKKSIDQRSEDNSYVFYDGPPFATGMPHYGHLLASTTKDVIPRFWTMKGKRVERRWGWDCHGLPIENIVEKELKLSDKRAIEEFGVAKFNEACRSQVLTYAHDWKEVIERLGRWVDMENDYKTMESWYMESLWWVFSQLWKKGLIYKGHKSMHICPRCNTPLSNFEVTQGYKDVKDYSVVAEFELKDTQRLFDRDEKIFALAWTTTPWTLPGNMLLAVNKKLKYILFSGTEAGKLYISTEDFLKQYLSEESYTIIKEIPADQIVGLSYHPLFQYFKDTENAFRVVEAEFVSAEEGTGIVHIAPGFGEDDYRVGEQENVPLVQHVGLDGKFTEAVTDFSGLSVKPKGNPGSTDQLIIEYLAENDQLFLQTKISHSYPHCWRCDTPLLNYATDSWFVKVTSFIDQLIKNNQQINWIPDHMKDGRFGMWLENAQDWAISRNRYWGTPLPIWENEDGDVICVESIEELEKLSGKNVSDLHKHFLDEIEIEKNGKVYKRIPEVLDCWFESGAMPYASFHYPFENREKFEKNFPAEFISEGQDQTRGWFYTLHVLATALTMGDQPAIPVFQSSSSFKNVIVNGIVLAQDGKKMSKSLKNYPDPMTIVDQYGADSLRLYLMSSSVMKAENLNFKEKEVSDLRRKVFLIWWNMLSFYKLYADKKHDVASYPKKPTHTLDLWLVSRIESLTLTVTSYLEQYDVVKASRELTDFVNDFSTWYLRLSRNRIKSLKNDGVSHVFGWSLYRLAQLFAPFTPFFSELVHHNILDEESSIHLSSWPESNEFLIDKNIETEMRMVMQIVESGRRVRAEKGSKLRHPLSLIKIDHPSQLNYENYEQIIKDELNVKAVEWNHQSDQDLSIEFDFNVSNELKAEAQARDLIREIQILRKESQLPIDAVVGVELPDWPEEWQKEIEQRTNTSLSKGDKLRLLNQ